MTEKNKISGSQKIDNGMFIGSDYKIVYRPDIEGLRAIAILLVVAAHAKVASLAGGFVGVDVFFVLSGYLITGLLFAEIAKTGSVSFRDFYSRRLKRLLPALLFMLVGTICLGALLLAPFEQLNQSDAALSAALWLSNIHFGFADLDYFGSVAESNLFLHTWSLGVEEQFYLVWPALVLLMLGAMRWQGSKRNSDNFGTGMVAIFFTSLVISIYCTYAAPIFAFYMMPLRAWQFSLGAIAFFLTMNTDASGVLQKVLVKCRRQKGLVAITGWIGLLLILFAAFFLDAQTPYPGTSALMPSIGAAAILLAGSNSSRFGVQRLLSISPLVGIGRISYGWYLWHWPVLLLGATVLAVDKPWNQFTLVAMSLLIAIFSYRLIESPIRKSSRLATRPILVLSVSALLTLATVAMAISWHRHATSWVSSPEQSRFQTVKNDMPIVYAEIFGCDEWYNSARVYVCGFGSKDAKYTAVIMGDSIGLQWFPALAKIYSKPDWKILVITKSACPMVDEAFFYQRIGREYVECAAWRTSAINALGSLKPDVVIFGSGAQYPFTKTQWIEGTSRILDVVSKIADQVYVIRATPVIPFDGPACLSRQHWQPKFLSKIDKCRAPAFSETNDDVFHWLTEAASRQSNATVVDLNGLVCPNGTCTADRLDKTVFRDTQHLTASFVESISKEVNNKLVAGSDGIDAESVVPSGVK